MADTLIELQNNPKAAEMPYPELARSPRRSRGHGPRERLVRRLSSARVRQAATIENVDYRTARGLDRSLFQSLATCQWIYEHNHLVIVGVAMA
ncbi:ATP-binding protein [Bradyrhizobium sp. CCBAU 21362]|uniref:ATP-binding protein n=1 Tax=Bradyrhizobium sp. CCBAU 21362 TaxID=1325082 RepID=UPI002305CD30|nr:ATP-binding protein [Bradyrhizobium sp. CCBAU 21362]